MIRSSPRVQLLASLSLIVILAGCFAPASDLDSKDASATTGASSTQEVGNGQLAKDQEKSERYTPSFTTHEVCFRVDFFENPGPSQFIRGTLFLPGNVTERTRAVLLMHGSSSTRQLFDGGPLGYGRDNDTTLPRVLALSGYAAFTIDFLGYGESPYQPIAAGSGMLLNNKANQDVLDDVLVSIKRGSYTFADTGCPGTTPAPFAFPSVIVGGHSGGAIHAQLYVWKGLGADGLISINYHNFGFNNEMLATYFACLGASADVHGYFDLLCLPGRCEAGLFNAGDVDEEQKRAFCASPRVKNPMGSGVFEDPRPGLPNGSTVRAMPVLLIFAELDAMMNEPVDNQAWRQAEVAQWRANCKGCSVTSMVLAGQGHQYMLYRTYYQVNLGIRDWLWSHAPPLVPAPPALEPAIQLDTFCADVFIQRDPIHEPVTVVGTMARPAGRTAATVLLMLPGAQATRSIFDEAPSDSDRDAGHTFQRSLARAGYGSVAIDRVGLGDSWYEGGPRTGDDLASTAQWDAIHQLVTALGEGTYRLGPGSCIGGGLGPAFDHVVLGGHSWGGILATNYAFRYHDLDGLLVLGTTPMTVASALRPEASAAIGACLAQSYVTGKRQLAFVCDDGLPERSICERFMFYAPTANLPRGSSFCAAVRSQHEPMPPEGFWDNSRTGFPETDLAGSLPVDPIPVHFVYYGNDGLMQDPASARAAESAVWANCECTYTDFVVPETGHIFALHAGQEVGYQDIVDWLAAGGFEPALPATPPERAEHPKEPKPTGKPPAPESVASDTFCADVVVPTSHDGQDLTIYGTFMRPVGETPATVLLLLPGVGTPRAVYDTAPTAAEHAAGNTLQRQLARAGYASVSIDRPNIGDSRYVEANVIEGRSGTDLTLEANMDVLLQLVLALRDGSWSRSEGRCPGASDGFAFPNVVLGGHSLGGLMAIRYAIQYPNIDGLLVLGADTTPSNSVIALTAYCQSLTAQPALGVVHPFCPNAPPTVMSCETFLSYPATASASVIQGTCIQTYTQWEGVGHGDLARYPSEVEAGIDSLPPIPVHNVFYEFDWAMSEPGKEQESVAEARASWSQCPCDYSDVIVPRTGHAFVAHTGQEVGYSSIVAWMQHHGF